MADLATGVSLRGLKVCFHGKKVFDMILVEYTLHIHSTNLHSVHVDCHREFPQPNNKLQPKEGSRSSANASSLTSVRFVQVL